MRQPAAAVPAARSEGLVVERLRDEVLVYDLEHDEVHHLNPTAAAIFDLADGQTTLDGLAARVTRRIGQPVGTGLVDETLAELAAKRLLEAGPYPDAGDSRREVIRKAALVGAGAAAAAPAIKSIVAPTPAQAQSQGCIPEGQPCDPANNGEDCCDPAGTSCEAEGPGGSFICVD
jgi:hypothetical protein